MSLLGVGALALGAIAGIVVAAGAAQRRERRADERGRGGTRDRWDGHRDGGGRDGGWPG